MIAFSLFFSFPLLILGYGSSQIVDVPTLESARELFNPDTFFRPKNGGNQNGKPDVVVLLCHSQTCGTCLLFMPDFEEAAKMWECRNNGPNADPKEEPRPVVSFRKVECARTSPFCKSHVKGTPTLIALWLNPAGTGVLHRVIPRDHMDPLGLHDWLRAEIPVLSTCTSEWYTDDDNSAVQKFSFCAEELAEGNRDTSSGVEFWPKSSVSPSPDAHLHDALQGLLRILHDEAEDKNTVMDRAQLLDFLTIAQEVLPGSNLRGSIKLIADYLMNQDPSYFDRAALRDFLHDFAIAGVRSEDQFAVCNTATCTYWMLLHVLSFGLGDYRIRNPSLALSMSSPVQMMEAIRGLVDSQFGCVECRQHFLSSYVDCSFGRCAWVQDTDVGDPTPTLNSYCSFGRCSLVRDKDVGDPTPTLKSGKFLSTPKTTVVSDISEVTNSTMGLPMWLWRIHNAVAFRTATHQTLKHYMELNHSRSWVSRGTKYLTRHESWCNKDPRYPPKESCIACRVSGAKPATVSDDLLEAAAQHSLSDDLLDYISDFNIQETFSHLIKTYWHGPTWTGFSGFIMWNPGDGKFHLTESRDVGLEPEWKPSAVNGSASPSNPHSDKGSVYSSAEPMGSRRMYGETRTTPPSYFLLFGAAGFAGLVWLVFVGRRRVR